ncbi:TRAP transporter small permease [Vibrio sp. JC009]|uniref:TRAP transporter small permease n=1 Tax=Vibrio sp. JC009 TaxID=2912314 RepID=UPI0023B1A8A0|nr:TRAP transporter small permease [Vibrio sp. JC009]WED24929.1 TRAP transporter small permease [Vibrio sp. JC009]
MFSLFKNAERNIAVVLFILLFCTLVLQIFSRYLLDMSIVWTEELSRWLYIYVVMLGASEAVAKRDHIAVDLVPNLLKPKARALLFIVIHTIYLVTCIYLVKLGYKSTLRMHRLEAITMDVPVSAVYVIVPVGFALMAFRSLIAIVEDCKVLFRKHSCSVRGQAQKEELK